jgi:tRNA threonylcarbamoyladenosine biosynthesis protein TsaE
MDSLTSDSPEQTFALGERLGRLVSAGDVIGFHGDLGAGKTLFAGGVARGLEVPSDYRVASPTFTLINEYPGREPLAHIDLYRLSEIDEMVEIGLFHYLGGAHVSLVEWFERLEVSERPEQRLELTFTVTGDETRQINASAHGERHAALLAAWIDACMACERIEETP